jgi:hypothetical protein
MVMTEKNPSLSAVSAMWCFLIGVYLLAGACYGFVNAKWPFFMPPQLDIFGLFFDLFGQRAGGYFGGGVLGVLGLSSLVLGILILANSQSKNDRSQSTN